MIVWGWNQFIYSVFFYDFPLIMNIHEYAKRLFTLIIIKDFININEYMQIR